jgi:release factor glutamine methyltransferase
MTSLREKQSHITETLSGIYEPAESASITSMLMEEALGYERSKLFLKQDEILTEEKNILLDEWTSRLLKHEPVQYVLGHAWFYDLKFRVTPAVLIPRRETEELVNLVIKEHQPEERSILDIGTGSGCIAISLKKNLAGVSVTAIDVSAAALEIAEQNSRDLDARVKFLERDILKWRSGPSGEKFDIVISNPPYVTESDSRLMSPNVKDYEPATALFVSDSNPLLFYREITDFALLHLNPGGKLYFEINESCGKEMVALLSQTGFEKIRLLQDMQGKDRFVAACLCMEI